MLFKVNTIFKCRRNMVYLHQNPEEAGQGKYLGNWNYVQIMYRRLDEEKQTKSYSLDNHQDRNKNCKIGSNPPPSAGVSLQIMQRGRFI